MTPEEDEPITVLMPVRNAVRTVSEAVSDLLQAVEDRDEVLVIDDGSEDGTSAVLATNRDPRLHVIRTKGVGLVDALNLGLREARHEWIARADADDRYPDTRLAHQRICRGNGVVLVSGDYSFVVNRRVIGTMPTALTHPFVLTSLVHPQRVPHPGVLLNREAVMSAGAYRRGDFPIEDLALWLRLASIGEFVGTPHEVVKWTMASTSVTHANRRKQRVKAATLLREQFPLSYVRSLNEEMVAKELAAYAGTKLAGERTVLLARDLRALLPLGAARNCYRKATEALLAEPVSTACAVLHLGVEKARREQARRQFSRSLARRWPSSDVTQATDGGR